MFSISCCCIVPRLCLTSAGKVTTSWLSLFCSWFLVLGEFGATLVEFTSSGCAQRLAAHSRTGVGIVENLTAPVGFGQIEASERVVFAKRVGRPVSGHKNAPQIGMAGEGDAEEVIDFALVPVRSGPDVDD